MSKKITDLQPQKKNMNKHTEHGERLLRKTVQQYGIADGITVAANDEAISGSLRIETLADMMPDVKIQIVETYGDTLLVNKRMDIPTPDTKTGRALSVASNQVANTDYNPDGELLKEWGNEDKDIKAMFAESEWEEITGEEKPVQDAEPQIDRAAELLEKWQVKTGDMFAIGEHRLICGDCTDAAVVARVMENQGATCFTSPPYNAGVSAQLSGNTSIDDNLYKDEYNDNQTEDDYFDLLNSFTNNALSVCDYVFVNIQVLAGNKKAFIRYWNNLSDVFCDVVIWRKRQAAPAAAKRVMDSIFEFVLVFGGNGSRAIGTRDFRGMVRNVFEGDAQHGNKFSDMHAATMPIYLPEYFIKTFTNENELIYEPFCGTGTTLVACQNLGRRGRAIEISPAYVAVALQRMADAFPGVEIKRLE